MGNARTEERRVVTSLFIDVVGSTELTIKLGSERLKGGLDQAFDELRDIIEREGGTVEKYIGDAIYALFGAPVAHADDPERAIRAAAGARAWATAGANREIQFNVRVGLETGEAIVDLAAAADTRQQMSVGVVVNTAARLQQRAEPGQVLVGPIAHDATIEIATFKPLGIVELKGLGGLEIWELDELRGTARRDRLPFVGRAAELELLELARRRARTRSVLALVSGPPGQGKTRLVEELLASDEGLHTLTARCRPGGEIGALTPLRELLLGDGPDTALDAIVAAAIEEPAERGRIGDALAHSAGIRASASLAVIGKEERADEILDAWRRFVHGLAVRGPLTLWVEDLHWAAPEVVSLIDRLTLTGEPMFVIGTARPEFAEEVGLRPTGDRFFIELEGLGPVDAQQLAASAGGESEDAVRRAEGNPLFIVELARTREMIGELPLTLQGALGARLDDLDPADRALLAYGAVIGETFASSDVAVLARRDAASISRALARLAARHYLDPIDGRYRFHHSLLRDVAYGRLLAADRMRLHARYAREGATQGDPEIVAHHWWAALGGTEAEWVWRAEDGLGAMRRDAHLVHLAAARRQASLFATDRAAALFERAYALATDAAERAEAKHALADAYAQDLRADEAWLAYREARRHYAAAGAVPPNVYIGALKIHLRIGAFREPPPQKEVEALVAEAEAVARATGDPGVLARTLVYSAFRDMDPTSEAADPTVMAEALRLSKLSDPATRRELLGWYANDLIREMQVNRALAVLDEMEAIPGETNELDRIEHLRGRALIALRRGALADLKSFADRLVGLSHRMSPHLRTHADVFVSHEAFARGDWDTVVQLAAATDRLIQASPATAFCGSASILLGHGATVHARAGRVDEARALVRRIATISYGEVMAAAVTTLALALVGERAWVDPTPTALPYAAATALAARRRDEALAIAAKLDALSQDGARFFAAIAEAVREEVSRDEGGPKPKHAALRRIGYVGWSELLGARAT